MRCNGSARSNLLISFRCAASSPIIARGKHALVGTLQFIRTGHLRSLKSPHQRWLSSCSSSENEGERCYYKWKGTAYKQWLTSSQHLTRSTGQVISFPTVMIIPYNESGLLVWTENPFQRIASTVISTSAPDDRVFGPYRTCESILSLTKPINTPASGQQIHAMGNIRPVRSLHLTH